MENKNENLKAEEKKEEAKKNILVLERPITFENNEIKEIDLSGLKEATAENLANARRMMIARGAVNDPFLERSPEFAMYVASIVAGKPIELIKSLKMVDAMTLRNMALDFLY